jgi:hypothetical protein
MKRFFIRDKKTGKAVNYGCGAEALETDDRKVAEDLVTELADYAIDAEIVERLL